MTSPVAYRHVPDLEAKLAEVIAAGATLRREVKPDVLCEPGQIELGDAEGDRAGGPAQQMETP